MNTMVRHIPPIHQLQKTAHFKQLCKENELEAKTLTIFLRNVLDDIRASMLADIWEGPAPNEASFIDYLFEQVISKIENTFTYTLQPVINATGTILHTNLGRALLSEAAILHINEVAKQFSNLEYHLQEGKRGSRHVHVERLICEITGAEAAMIVNNNAAAVYLVLSALAKDKEVIVSRGQLVEIGGSFRISSIMEESGAKLVEVGTTNKTKLSDYEKAINEDTRMIMKVHTSNFIIKGFTETVATEELAPLCKKHDELIFYEDLGSGVLYDFQQLGIGNEPTVTSVLSLGADIVSFSGDKLLGGPQAGIIAGKKTLIDQLKKHQLARVLRVDKMTLAALEATLMHYAKGEALEKIPTLQMISLSDMEIKQRIETFREKLLAKRRDFMLTIRKDKSQIGGGTMPEVELDTYVLVVKHPEYEAAEMEKMLRTGTPRIITRVQNNELFFDFRTIAEKEEIEVLNALINMQ